MPKRKSFDGFATPIDTVAGKRAFIRALATNIRNQILAAVPKMPSEWTGHELRSYLADITERERTSLMRKGKRKRDYINTVITENL